MTIVVVESWMNQVNQDVYGESGLKKEIRLLEEKINGDADQLIERQGEYRAICLFKSQKIEKKQRFAIIRINRFLL